jgi:hypothetical protein
MKALHTVCNISSRSYIACHILCLSESFIISNGVLHCRLSLYDCFTTALLLLYYCFTTALLLQVCFTADSRFLLSSAAGEHTLLLLYYCFTTALLLLYYCLLLLYYCFTSALFSGEKINPLTYAAVC